ncbi:MAG: AIR synthase related protein, partial [Chloroflexi bacterium]|nr:AIR synthase related protein [Chloroflexota bacterium]
MPLDERGEFGLIARILERLGEAAALDIAVPPGDDAAAWAAEPGLQIATVDAQVEGTHWRRDTMSLADVGWRAVATAVSDLAAMGARASYVLIAAELGPGLSAE